MQIKHFATPHELDIAEAMQVFRKTKTLDPVLTWNEPRELWTPYVIHRGYYSELKQELFIDDWPSPLEVEVEENDTLNEVLEVDVPPIPWTNEEDDDDDTQDLMHPANMSEQALAYKARYAYENLMQLLTTYR
jgi:hypothetical protein